MRKTDPPFQLEQAIGFQLNRTAFLMTEEIARRFKAHGYPLSAQDFGILIRLQQHGSMTQVAIAEMMMRDKTTITRRLDGLVKKGAVIRTPHPEDRRAVSIELTETGQKAMQIMVPLVRDFQHEVLQNIPDADKAATIRTLQSISDTLIGIKQR